MWLVGVAFLCPATRQGGDPQSLVVTLTSSFPKRSKGILSPLGTRPMRWPWMLGRSGHCSASGGDKAGRKEPGVPQYPTPNSTLLCPQLAAPEAKKDVQNGEGRGMGGRLVRLRGGLTCR